MKRTKASTKLSEQMEKRARKKPEIRSEYDGNQIFVSTGSTLLDLAITGGRVRGGGIPGGILMEIFGPASSGKTVLLCEIAGAIQRQGGQVMFRDPEARLNLQFAQMFGLDVEGIMYDHPATVPEVFAPVRSWEPDDEGVVNGIIADSLAALSTNMELEDKDAMGMRRAKEFSEECRKTCRTLTEKGFLMVCSNQVRENLDAGPYGQKYKSPGGMAIGFYASLRLRCMNPKKIRRKKSISGKDVVRVVGVETEIEVFKSSIWKPHRTAPIHIYFDYGIDNIRANLQFVKTTRGNKVYTVGKDNLSKSLDKSIYMVEKKDLENELKEEVIDLWEKVEEQFKDERKEKKR